MVKLCFCMRRLPHLTREEFLEYWGKKHTRAGGPRAIEILGMRKYCQVRTLSAELNREVGSSRPGIEPEFDGIAEIWLDSVEAYQRDWSSPEGMETMKGFLDDEKNFVDWSRSTVFLAEEKIMFDQTGG